MDRRYLQLIYYKAAASLRVEASRGYLGMIWWVLEPVLYMGAFYIIFGVAFKRGGEDFIAFLLVGLVTWKWFAASVNNASRSVAGARGLISQVYVPKMVFPIAIVAAVTFKSMIIFLLLLAFLLLSGPSPSVHWAAVPLVAILQLLFILGVAGVLSALMPLLPDLNFIIDNLLLLMFFLSGVFFDLAELDGTTIGEILSWNPMAILIEAYRDTLLHQRWPDQLNMLTVLAITSAFLLIAWSLHRRFDRVYPKVV